MTSEDNFIVATFNHCGGSTVALDILKPGSNVTIEKSKIKNKSDKLSRQKRHHTYNYKMTIADRPIGYNGRAFGTHIHGRHAEEAPKIGSEWILALRSKNTGHIIYKPAKFLTFSPNMELVEDNDAVIVDKDGYGDLKRKLTLHFGSKKKKRALETHLSNSLHNDSLTDIVNVSVTKVKKDETLGHENGGTEFSGTPRKNPASSVLPAFNPNATTPAEIFDVNDIVSPDECLLLEADARIFAELSHKDRKEAGYADYICELASSFPSQQAPRELRSVYLLYFNYLTKLYQVSTKRRNFELKLLEMELKSDNAEFNRRLLSKYAEEEQFKRGKSYRVFAAGKDKILAHSIVLYLNLNNFSFTLSKLCHLLPGVQEGKLTTICNLLGCKVKKFATTNEKIISLVKPPPEKIHSMRSSSKRR
uniref:Uncharacterized protein n=1 Tax=Romanomermis culicivorax TaxID=13658 RepID=A0A915HMQ9_ROMCU